MTRRAERVRVGTRGASRLRRAVWGGLAAASALAATGAAGTALAGDVQGSLTVAPATPAAPADPARARYWEEWNGVLDPRPMRPDPSREVAVVLTGAGPVSTAEQPPYRVSNGTLAPTTIVARVGGALQLRNDDGIAYELFAEGFAEFGPIQTAPGNARPITVTEAGHWVVRDRLHPHVEGHLVAVPDLVARGVVEADGSYTFHGVAAGSYTLRVYRAGVEVAHADVVVAGDAPVHVAALPVPVPPAAPAAEPRP